MKKTMKAVIHWMPPEEGGRKAVIPVGMRYCPMLVFENEQPGDSQWSAEVYNNVVDGRTSSADVSYLMEDAPMYLLQPGKKFMLYEGQRVVAEGELN